MRQTNGQAAEIRMLEDAKAAIRASGEFLTVADLARLLHLDRDNLDRQLNAWKNSGEIFSIPGGMEGELFPRFALDSDRGPQVFEAIPKILRILEASCPHWGLHPGLLQISATWMTSPLRI